MEASRARAALARGVHWVQSMVAANRVTADHADHAARAARAERARQPERAQRGPVAGVAAGRTELDRGSRGPAVRQVQHMLNAHGHRLAEDGIYGPRTEAAVERFQRRHGLDDDGIVGDRTLKKLREKTPGAGDSDGDRFLRVGSRGEDVKTAERRLVALGYDPGRVDGRYDRDTAQAVSEFKGDQKEIKDGSGRYLGTPAQDSLRREVAALRHPPEHRRVPRSAENPALDRATSEAAARTNPDGTVGLGAGDQGLAVRNFQQRLGAAGYDPKHRNGTFDERTEGALKAFQRTSGLPVTGRVDERTWAKLEDSHLHARNATSPAQERGERSRAVLRTERLLDRAGYDPGKTDGLFDGGTQRALRRFERDHPRGPDMDVVGRPQLRAIERAARDGAFVRPIAHRLTPGSEFRLPDAEGAPSSSGGRYHAGKDWFAPGGSRVASPIAGKIVEVTPSRGSSGQVFGGVVKVQGRDGKVWVFRHVNPGSVREGQNVRAGQNVARVTNWSDGPSHAHVELWKTLGGGYRIENMIDPMKPLGRYV